jgi:hypothetical protein
MEPKQNDQVDYEPPKTEPENDEAPENNRDKLPDSNEDGPEPLVDEHGITEDPPESIEK